MHPHYGRDSLLESVVIQGFNCNHFSSWLWQLPTQFCIIAEVKKIETAESLFFSWMLFFFRMS